MTECICTRHNIRTDCPKHGRSIMADQREDFEALSRAAAGLEPDPDTVAEWASEEERRAQFERELAATESDPED